MNSIQNNNNYIKVKNLVNEIVDDILNKWLFVIEAPNRLVMVKMDWCSICDTTLKSNECYIHNYDSPTGHGVLGWSYCQKCKIYNKLIDLHYYKNYTLFIRGKYIQHLLKNTFSFYRKPSIDKYPSYIEKEAFYVKTIRDFIFLDKQKNKICVTIGWDNYMKNISLTNLIFYNRKLFGYEYNHFPIKNYPNIMISYLQKDYYHCKEWYVLDCIFNFYKKNIPFEIQKIIFRYWNNLFIL